MIKGSYFGLTIVVFVFLTLLLSWSTKAMAKDDFNWVDTQEFQEEQPEVQLGKSIKTSRSCVDSTHLKVCMHQTCTEAPCIAGYYCITPQAGITRNALCMAPDKKTVSCQDRQTLELNLAFGKQTVQLNETCSADNSVCRDGQCTNSREIALSQ